MAKIDNGTGKGRVSPRLSISALRLSSQIGGVYAMRK